MFHQSELAFSAASYDTTEVLVYHRGMRKPSYLSPLSSLWDQQSYAKILNKIQIINLKNKNNQLKLNITE